MKKRLLFILLSVTFTVTVFMFRVSTYKSPVGTVPCGDSGLIFTITTYDGKTESGWFVRSLGHTWVSLDNQTGHSVYLRDHEVKDGEIITFSVWATTGHRGVFFNLEAEFIRAYDRYIGRQSLSIPIDESQLADIGDYIENNDRWKPGKNCSYWAMQLWNVLADDAHRLPSPLFFCTPARLQKILREFDGVETDKDFSRAEGVFFHKNGQQTELWLCS